MLLLKLGEGTGEVVSLETLKEVVRVKYQDGDEFYFKKHDAKDIVVIKDADVNYDSLEAETEEDLEELRKLEKLEKDDKKNSSDDI